MGFIPKDYIGVHTRVEKYHTEHTDKASILTDFRVDWNIVSFKATITTDKWIFNWSSFWTIDKEKAFEKLETVAVGRALAFAWYDIKSGIASSEEMEIFTAKVEEDEEAKDWFWEANFLLFKEIKWTYTKATAVKEARKNYKVSKAWASKIEGLYDN